MEANSKLKIKELKDRLSKLISYHTKRKDDSVAINQQLYKKKESLTEIEMMGKLPSQYLNAYLKVYFLFKQAVYSNFQEEHLKINNFDEASYLERLEQEIVISEKSAGLIDDVGDLQSKYLSDDYPLFVLNETETRGILELKEKLLGLAQQQAEKMWEENKLGEVFGLPKDKYIELTVETLYNKLIKKYFYETNNKNKNDRK